jgi:hypothetical protein
MEKEDRNKHSLILKVTELGLDGRVYEAMKQPRFSVEALTRQLNEEGIEITAQSIRKFIKKTKKAQQELISRDLRAADEYRQITLNYGKALKDILVEVEQVKNTSLAEKDYTTYNQLIGRIMQGIELVAKLTGDIKPKGSIDINIIYQEINEDVDRKMKTVKNDIFRGKIIDIDAEVEEEDVKIASKK